MASVLKSSALTEYSFAFRFPNLQWNIKLVTLFTHQLHPLIYGLVNQKLSITAVIIGFFFFCGVIWLDSDNSRLSVSLSKIVLTVTWVSGIVKSSWSEYVVAKHFIGPNTPFCGWRSWYDSIEVGEQCVIREVYEQPVGFFCKGAAWCYIKSDQGVLACSMFLLEVIVIWYTGLWSYRC